MIMLSPLLYYFYYFIFKYRYNLELEIQRIENITFLNMINNTYIGKNKFETETNYANK